MAGATPDLDGIDRLIGILEAQLTRLQVLERATGTQVGSLVEQVQAALATIRQTVRDVIAEESYTRGQADAQFSPAGHGHDQSAITGAWTKDVATGGTVQGNIGRFNGGLYSTDARNFVVTSNYAASWIDVNGHFGISPSTRRFKKNIEAWTLDDAERILSIEAKSYRLSIPARVILRMREDGAGWVLDENGYPEIDQVIEAYEDPPDAPLRQGFIAEDLVDAGLGFLIVFDDDGLPVSINYAEFTIAQQTALRWLNQQRQQQEDRLATIEHHLGLT